MSKERLEEIVYNVGVSLDGEKVIVSGEHYDFLYNYAIQQTERVEELEEINTDAITQIDVMQKRNERLERQNKRYREALEFYADRDNYKLEHFDPNLDDYMSTVDYDEGQKARQTIRSEKTND